MVSSPSWSSTDQDLGIPTSQLSLLDNEYFVEEELQPDFARKMQWSVSKNFQMDRWEGSSTMIYVDEFLTGQNIETFCLVAYRGGCTVTLGEAVTELGASVLCNISSRSSD